MGKRKKKRGLSITRIIFVFNIVAVLTLLLYFAKPIRKYALRAYRYYMIQEDKAVFEKTGFPAGYKVHGIDISHYQTKVDWDNLKSVSKLGDTISYQFVVVKATEGTWLEDELFEKHWKNATKKKIIKGAYHYYHPNKSNDQQARNFIESVSLGRGDLPPVIDIEESKKMTKREIVKSLKDFIKLLENHYHVKPIIYSNRNFIEDYLSDDFDNYIFWVAHYERPSIVFNDVKWMFWQHNDKARLLNGQQIDANVFNGTKSDLRKITIGGKQVEFKQGSKSE
jgi:lysozyme